MDAKAPATTLDPVILALTQNRLDHISHQMGPYAALERELPSGIQPAYDGLVLEV